MQSQEVLPIVFLQPLLPVLRIEGAVERVDLALDALHGLDRVLHLVDQAALDGLGELDRADGVRHLDEGTHGRPSHAAILAALTVVLAFGCLLQLLVELFIGRARLADGVDLLLNLLRPFGNSFVGDLLVVEDDQLADGALACMQLIAKQDHFFRDQGRTRNRLDDRQLAALDAPRDLDFALARQEWNRAHLSEVHPHRIVRLVEGTGRQIELDFLGALTRAVDRLVIAQILLVGVDDFDARAAECIEEVVEFLGRGDLGRQQLVHLVVEQVALLLADGDQLTDFVVFFFDRQWFSPHAHVSSSMRRANVRFWFRSRLISLPCWPDPSPCSRSISR